MAQEFKINQGDTLPVMKATAPTSFGDITGWTIEFKFDKLGTIVTKTATITDGPNRQFEFTFSTTDTDTDGRFKAQIRFIDLSGGIQKTADDSDFYFVVKRSVGFD